MSSDDEPPRHVRTRCTQSEYRLTVKKILRDQSFSEHILRTAKRVLQWNNDSKDKGNSGAADLATTKTTLQMLAALDEDSTAFSNLETLSNYGSNEDTSDTQSVRSVHRPINGSLDVRAADTSVQTSPDAAETPIQAPPDSPRGEEDTMPYPYQKYNEEPDAEAHIRAFLTTWQANHVSQRLSTVDADASKIANFGLSLEGQAANWYS